MVCYHSRNRQRWLVPSEWPLHEASAIVLLASIYTYFAVVLYRAGRPLLMMIHLSVPLVLAIVTRFQSYGMWQKWMICYFILAAVVHHDVLKRGARARARTGAQPVFDDREVRALHQM